MNNKQRETFKMLCDTLREAVRYDMEDLRYSEDNRDAWVIADQAVKDRFELIRIMLRDSGFIIPEDFSVENMCTIFRSCLLCCDQCESCAEWEEVEGLTGFAACCYDNVVGYGLAVKYDTSKEEKEEEEKIEVTSESDDIVEADPYKTIENYNRIVNDLLDELYEREDYEFYTMLVEKMRENGLWK